MAIMIPSLIHAACNVRLQGLTDPKLTSALGVKSIARAYTESFGAFDIRLEQPVDPKTALLFASVNWSEGPAVCIQAMMDVEDSTLVHVYTSQNVVAAGTFTDKGLGGGAYGFTSNGHSSTGVYDFTLATSLHAQNDGYDGVSIFVTPSSSRTLARWNVLTDTRMQVLTTDETGSMVDSGFSLALLPSGQGSYNVDCDFCLLVGDLSAAGALALSE